MPDTAADLYEQDFYRWSEVQAAALRQAARAGTNLPLDWGNLAEEIEGLGISQKNELGSRLATVLEHLLKLEHSPAKNPRRNWMGTIARERSRIEALLEHNPSLKSHVGAILDAERPRAARLTTKLLFGHGETTSKLPTPAYTEEQVLGDWFPETAKSSLWPARRRPTRTRGAS